MGAAEPWGTGGTGDGPLHTVVTRGAGDGGDSGVRTVGASRTGQALLQRSWRCGRNNSTYTSFPYNAQDDHVRYVSRVGSNLARFSAEILTKKYLRIT